MARDIFGGLPSTVPTKDSRIVRVQFDENELGARKAHLPKPPRNDMTIEHVKQGGR